MGILTDTPGGGAARQMGNYIFTTGSQSILLTAALEINGVGTCTFTGVATPGT